MGWTVPARRLRAQPTPRSTRHESPPEPSANVKLVPGQFVKPFPKGQKNDFRDAEAVAEANNHGCRPDFEK
jgi:hypothetical protein